MKTEGIFWKLTNLTGPIFGKELVVSSRRRRNYVLRFVYIGLMTLFLIFFWAEEIYSGGSTLYRASRMAEVGKGLVAVVVWFQFIMCQLVAIVMLSTSISDEIYHKTLGVLMTTPINSFQIVAGKLLSKLLQLVILIAISLPLLAIVRIFGGVPWDFLVCGICLTLSTAIFFGSVSLFFSICCRRAYVTILVSFLVLGAIFGLVPLLTAMLYDAFRWSEHTYMNFFAHSHPYFQMIFNTGKLLEPRATGMFNIHWLFSCGVMLGLSTVILGLSIALVRRIALRQATGQAGLFEVRRRTFREKSNAAARAGTIRKVRGKPVLWKELKMPLLGKRKKTVIAILILTLLVLFFTYAFFADENAFDDEEFHMLYTIIFMSLGMLFTIVIPATVITSEKESQSWHLLLTTTQSDWQILFGKFAGAVRRCLPAWIFLMGHIIIFSSFGFIHPLAIFLTAILVFWVIVFHTSTGIYFSSRFKHTTTAVIMNFVLPAILWGLIPFVIGIFTEIFRFRFIRSNDTLEYYIDVIPFIQNIVVIEGTTNTTYMYSRGNYNYNDSFHWPQGPSDALGTIEWMIFFMLLYLFISFIFLWRAKCNFRKKIF